MAHGLGQGTLGVYGENPAVDEDEIGLGLGRRRLLARHAEEQRCPHHENTNLPPEILIHDKLPSENFLSIRRMALDSSHRANRTPKTKTPQRVPPHRATKSSRAATKAKKGAATSINANCPERSPRSL